MKSIIHKKMDTMVFLAVGVCILVIFLSQWFLSRGKLPPGPFNLPVVGYTPFLSAKPYLDLQQLAKKYGNVYSIRFGSAYVVVLNDFESTREAFAQDAFIGRPPASPCTLNKETIETKAIHGLPWKEHRRFSLHMLKGLGLGKTKMEDNIQEEINDLLHYIEQNTDKPFYIKEVLAPSMSNNISALMFGKRLKYDDPIRQMMTRTVKKSASAARQTKWQLFFPWIKKILQLFGIGSAEKASTMKRELRDYIMNEIEVHEKTLDRSNVRDYIDGYLVEIEKRKDDPSFCKPVLQDVVNSFFGAGSESVQLTVEWLLLTTAVHQDAQRRIQREIDEITDKTRPLSWMDQRAMPFTEAFIMELMRWRTIIPINVLRYALVDGEINGYRIPKGSRLMSNLWAIHHNPEYWGQDVDDFRPERFLSDDGQESKKWEHFIPFSIGKRACPGEPLGRIEVFLYFTSILQKFCLILPEGKVADFDGELGIGLMPKPQELIFAKR